ncbi:MAG TPA: GFA family protein [Caulobacteraceae bacterium]|jgi:hypothetical protein
MATFIEGGCRCGRLRYRLEREAPPKAYACHCHDCQTWSGSAFSLQIFVPEGDLEITGQSPDLYSRPSLDGQHTSHQRGCAVCFTRIFNTNTRRPGIAVLRAGTLDRSDEVPVVAHIWTKRKMPGIAIPDGVPSWPEGAPPMDLLAAVS